VDDVSGARIGGVVVGIESSLEAPVFGSVYRVSGPGETVEAALGIEFSDFAGVREFVGCLVAGLLARAGVANCEGADGNDTHGGDGVWRVDGREGVLLRRNRLGLEGKGRIRILFEEKDATPYHQGGVRLKMITGDENAEWDAGGSEQGKNLWTTLEEMMNR